MSAARLRACCGSGRCYKAHHLRVLKTVTQSEARRLVAELGACERGLLRDDLVRATCMLADRGALALSWECITEMSKRDMRPSLVAHNKLLDAYARLKRWDLGMSLLLRMQQHGLQPDESSFIAVIRAGAGTPGSSQLADVLRPQLEEAARRDNAPPRTTEETRSHGVVDQVLRRKLPSSGKQSSKKAMSALVSAASSDPLAHKSGGTSTPGLSALQQQLAMGRAPDARSFLMALSGCAKQRGRWREAMQLTAMMEVWVRQKRERAKEEDVGRAFAAAIAACDQSGQKDAAHALLPRMAALGVPPRLDALTSAISACRHGGGDAQTAEAFFAQLRRHKLAPDAACFNSLLTVFTASGGMGSEALGLLRKMQAERVTPDHMTYFGVLTACRPTAEQTRTLKRLALRRRASSSTVKERLSDGLRTAVSSAQLTATPSDAHTPFPDTLVASGPGDGCPVDLLVLQPRPGAQEAVHHAPSAAVGGVWSGGVAPWEHALALLPEMQLRGIKPSVLVFSAAIELCARSADVDRALQLLFSMPRLGLRPDGFCLVGGATAASAFGEYRLVLAMLADLEAEVTRRRLATYGRDGVSGLVLPLRPPEGLLGLFPPSHRRAEASRDAPAAPPPVSFNRNTRERLHGAAVMACAVGRAPLPQSLALIAHLREKGLTAGEHAFGAGIEACVRQRAWREAAHLLHVAAEAGVPPLSSHYSKVIRIFSQAHPVPPWALTTALVDRAAAHNLVLPAAAQLHLLKVGVAAGMGWDAVELVRRVDFNESARISCDGLYTTTADANEGAGSAAGTRRGRRGHIGPGQDTRTLEAQIQGELLCLAAQDGTSPERLSTLLRRLREAELAPTRKLLHEALFACRLARRERQAWRNTLPLLKVARLESIGLTAEGFITAIEAHAPAEARTATSTTMSTSPPAANDIVPMLRELADHLLDETNLSARVASSLKEQCASSPAMAAHVQLLYATLGLGPASAASRVTVTPNATAPAARRPPRRKPQPSLAGPPPKTPHSGTELPAETPSGTELQCHAQVATEPLAVTPALSDGSTRVRELSSGETASRCSNEA